MGILKTDKLGLDLFFNVTIIKEKQKYPEELKKPTISHVFSLNGSWIRKNKKSKKLLGNLNIDCVLGNTIMPKLNF